MAKTMTVKAKVTRMEARMFAGGRDCAVELLSLPVELSSMCGSLEMDENGVKALGMGIDVMEGKVR